MIFMGYYQCCRSFFKLLPWATCIATTLCWGGTIGFCASGAEALSSSFELLKSLRVPGLLASEVFSERMLYPVSNATYGIAGFMFSLSILLLFDGSLSTKLVKGHSEDRFKSSLIGLKFGYFCGFLIMVGISCWFALAAVSAIPLGFYTMCYYQCSYSTSASFPAAVCVDFSQTGLIAPPLDTNDVSYGRLCGDHLQGFCHDSKLLVIYRLFVVCFVSSLLVHFALIQYAICWSANTVYVKTNSRSQVDEKDTSSKLLNAVSL